MAMPRRDGAAEAKRLEALEAWSHEALSPAHFHAETVWSSPHVLVHFVGGGAFVGVMRPLTPVADGGLLPPGNKQSINWSKSKSQLIGFYEERDADHHQGSDDGIP